ncbi:hypothetical protein HK104_001702 [Borealophlyctis nickersoniae]|nr:hypothetical protein HK104_001702 [Borealophlyctis nickersoniae]
MSTPTPSQKAHATRTSIPCLIWCLIRNVLVRSLPGTFVLCLLAGGAWYAWTRLEGRDPPPDRAERVMFGVLVYTFARSGSVPFFTRTGTSLRIFLRTFLTLILVYLIHNAIQILVAVYWPLRGSNYWVRICVAFLITGVGVVLAAFKTVKTLHAESSTYTYVVGGVTTSAAYVGFLVGCWFMLSLSTFLAARLNTSQSKWTNYFLVSLFSNLSPIFSRVLNCAHPATHTQNIVCDGFGYPLLRFSFLRILEVTIIWGPGGHAAIVAKRLMYETFFGIVGRIIVLRIRQPSVFYLSMFAAQGMDVTRRVVEATALRYRLSKVGPGKDVEGYEDGVCAEMGVDGVVRSVDVDGGVEEADVDVDVDVGDGGPPASPTERKFGLPRACYAKAKMVSGQ